MSHRRTISLQREQNRPLLNDTESQQLEKSTEEWVDQPSAARRRRIMLKAVALARPAHLVTTLKRFIYCFVPQLIRTQVFDDPAPADKQFSTSYLNGLRGMTALKVFTFHYFMVFTDATHVAYGADDRHTYITELPLIRYFWTGFTSHIFFGVAGYLTCQRLFILLDKNDQASQAKVLLSVSGSLFRRAFRLYLPVFLITLLMATYIHLGYYESNRPLLLSWERLFPGDWNETKPDMYPTWFEQLKYWGLEMYRLCNIVSADTVYPLHDQHLWSILAEMRASLHLHGIVIALAQCKRHVRLIMLWILVFLYFYWQHWEIWVYLLGAIVAQIDQILNEREAARKALPMAAATEHTADPEKDHDTSSMSSTTPGVIEGFQSFFHVGLTSSIHLPTAYRALRITGFLIAFYFLSYPIHGSRDDHCPGYETLNLFIPEWMERKDKFYANWGTFLLLLLIVRSDAKRSRWRQMTSHWLTQYLGKISFAFYLVQAIIQQSFGYLIPHHIWWSFGVEGIDTSGVAWISAIAVGWTITLIATLWMADCWNREIEVTSRGKRPSIERHLYLKTLERARDDEDSKFMASPGAEVVAKEMVSAKSTRNLRSTKH
ncbi:hypothetical protein LTR24_000825 [Lithohypha guttulata]|uniref:Acyltransferase 3 domain-containing protein n=1 Tax=Lithohypha guttulata TaxID=1690604 RepID=A0ABR0KM69_9EURO|nr:hypothetical protein LTR24_000825 [Lithohypha guttulata]